MSRHTAVPPRRRFPRPRRSRLIALVAVTAFLVAGGSAASWAVWSTSAATNTTAGAASVAVTETLASGSSLALTYNSTTTAGVGSVTVTNTSTRDGSYSLAATATSSSSTLRSAVAVEIGTAASCTTGATLTGSVTGTFAAAVTKTGTLTAGSSVTLCVRTSMTAANITSNATASLAATLTAGVTVGTWTASANNLTFAQSVAGATAFVTVDANRYHILNQGVCISSTWDFAQLSRNAQLGGSCTNEQTAEFRVLDVGDGTKYIGRASVTTTHWNAASSTSVTLAAGTTASNQKWTITLRPDGTYRFVNSAYATQCLAITAGNLLTFATCDNASAAQGFTFELVANSQPPAVTLTCTGNGSSYIVYGWPVLTGYQAEVTYKGYVNGAYVGDFTNGYDPFARMYKSGGTPVIPVATLGAGTWPVEIKQSVNGGPFTSTGTGSLIITAGALNLTCG